MRTDVLLLYPDITEKIFSKTNIGLSYISSTLNNAGYSTDILYMTDVSKNKITLTIKKNEPKIIGIYCSTNNWEHVKKIAKIIKETSRDTKIFVGGPHTTYSPECILETEAIDGVCRGEGELAFLELVDDLFNNGDYLNTKNFWFRHEGGIIKNDVGPLIENLDELPLADKRIYGIKARNPYTGFIFSRGCPFDCSYCINPFMKELYHGKGRFCRQMGVERSIEEIENAFSTSSINKPFLIFHDDVINLNRDWFFDFFDVYTKRFKIPFFCHTRPEYIDVETVKTLKKAGCRYIGFGVESGNYLLRDKILNRKISNREMIEKSKIIRENDIQIFTYNIIGLPTETPKKFEETIELNKKIKPDVPVLFYFHPFPGTRINDMLKDNYFGERLSITNNLDDISFIPQGFTGEQIEKYKMSFSFRVKGGYSKRHFMMFKLYKILEKTRFEIVYLKLTSKMKDAVIRIETLLMSH